MPVKAVEADYFRHTSPSSALGETVRAYLVFGVLLVILVGIAVQLAFREAGLGVVTERLALIHREAETIAAKVMELGRDGNGINFSRLRANRQILERFIASRFEKRSFLQHVEIRDRFGVRQLFRARDQGRGPLPEKPPPGLLKPAEWPLSSGAEVIQVPLGHSEGEVRVGLAPGPVLEEMKQLRRSLRIKVTIAAALAVGVLIAGFFYVLYLLRKNRRLEQSRQSAARASYVGLLASGLAHEIRNPLNAMNMNLQMLEEELQGMPECADGDHGELLESTKREIKRLESLVNNFLAYARPGSPSFESRDLNELVAETLRFLEGDFRQSEVEIVTELQPLLPNVEIDERLFKQALMNLLVNARQVLDPGGTITVRTRAGASGGVVLEVEDDGPGIPEEARERIFEVFYSSRGGGTGLGLPIARQIVERHGGRIDVRSTVGRGTIFTIHLPRRHVLPKTDEPAQTELTT